MGESFWGGLGMNLGALPMLTNNVETRSICAENPTGEKGKGGMAVPDNPGSPSRHLGQGWKVRPCIKILGGETATLAEIEGSGVVQHIWITTFPGNWRKLMLRMYWDGEATPSVEAPLGDFFCQAWGENSNVVSMPIAVNPRGGLNCFWPMPFGNGARITIENVTPDEIDLFFYQITYAKTEVPDTAGRFHAQWRRTNPVPKMDVHTIVDGIRGHGHYVGTYLAWQANSSGWWGEGEIKFYMDGDDEFPTICGTGTEDYVGGAWGFEQPAQCPQTYTTPFMGFHQLVAGDGQTRQGRRFGMYRWHVMDPIRFADDLRVTIQALGIGPDRGGHGRYVCFQDDLASVAYWYQSEPHAKFPESPSDEELEII